MPCGGPFTVANALCTSYNQGAKLPTNLPYRTQGCHSAPDVQKLSFFSVGLARQAQQQAWSQHQRPQPASQAQRPHPQRQPG